MSTITSTYKKIKIIANQEINISYKLIAEYLLNNLNDIKIIKIKNIMLNTFCSSSTVVRFTKHVGFSSFKEFMFELQKEVEYIKNNKTSRTLTKSGLKKNAQFELYHNIFVKNIEFIFKKNIKTIIEVNKEIKKTKTIFIISSGANNYPSAYLQNILLLNDHIVYYSRSTEMSNTFIDDFLKPEDLVFFISYRFSKDYTLDLFNKVKSKGNKTVVISQNKNMLNKTDYFIELGETEFGNKKNMSSVGAISYIINILCL